MILIVSTDYEVALAFYRFLSRSLEGAFLVQLDCLPTPGFFIQNIQNDNRVVISSSTTLEWMVSYLDNREIIDCWIIEPYRSILSRVYDTKFVIDYFEERVAAFAQANLPRHRWMRLPEYCISQTDIISLVRHLVSASLQLNQTRILEAYRLELGKDLARLVLAPAVRGITLGVTYKVCVGGVGTCFLESGWFPPEEAHTWSHGGRAFIALPLHSQTTQELTCHLELTFMTVNSFVQIKCNNRDVFSIFDNAVASRRRVTFPVSTTYKKGQPYILLELISNPMRPKDLDPSSADDRQIGVGLWTIRVENSNSQTKAEGKMSKIDIDQESFIQYVGLKRSFGTVNPMTGVNIANDFLGIAFASCLPSGSHPLRTFIEASDGLRQVIIVDGDDHSQLEITQLASGGNKQIFQAGLSATLHWIRRADKLVDYGLFPSFEEAIEFIEKIDLYFPGRSSGRIVDIIHPPSDLSTNQKEWMSRHFNRVTFSRSRWRMYR